MKFFRKRDDAPGSIKNFYGNKGTDAVEEANQKYFGDSGDSIHHSRYYHRYYEGYTEVRRSNPGSKYKPYKILRVYTAPFTVVDMDPGLYLIYKIFYGLLAGAADAMFILAYIDRSVSINMSKLSALTTIVTAGGDTDTNAAITAPLLAAIEGLDSLPPEWLRCVRQANPEYAYLLPS